jgi:DNA-binding GntR family transcriptional regulator
MTLPTADEDTWALPAQRSLPDIVAERVIDAIRHGELKPGERIVEVQLAKRLGVSRGPLREALKMLEAAQVVESQRSRGTFVANISPAQISQMMVVRATLEGMAARLVARRRSPQLIALLEEIHRKLQAASEAGRADEMRTLVWLFHETVCRNAHNDFLLSAWSAISNLIRVFLRQHVEFEHDPSRVISNQEKMLAVLREGSPDQAEAMFRNTILESSYRILKIDPPEGLTIDWSHT